MASAFTPPYFGRVFLADLHPRGFIAPSASIAHEDLRLGAHVFIGDCVVIFGRGNAGPVTLEDAVHLYGDTQIYTADSGSVRIGQGSHIQQRCYFSSFLAPIEIGRRAEIAPNCAFYSHSHGTAAGVPIREQPLSTQGGIVIEDDVWLGFGVTVLDGVRIGSGAVIGAGSVVTTDIPDNMIASGVPARPLRKRL
jgi:carbonic anhydrase/acetyltransferase-like protein (isoleucine patch superfamily)